ncbi:hypothetical protein [Peribacillus sp. NPDC096540]|uniref:hypothetical protein n=1 Tax=Peribacillus sp. NPDC096540 TaxID=3390612 RepID=UPI003D048B60
MFKKIFTVLTICAVAFGFSFSPTSHASSGNVNSTDWAAVLESGTVNGDDISVDRNQMQMAEKLSNYFETDADGNINFTADKETLMNMGISESDAELMTSITSDDLTITEGEQQDIQGFVGLYFYLGPKVRGMSAVLAGAFAAGYVGWYVKQIAAAGPWGAGAAATITAATAGVVGYGVKKKLKKVQVGVYMNGFSLSWPIFLP